MPSYPSTLPSGSSDRFEAVSAEGASRDREAIVLCGLVGWIGWTEIKSVLYFRSFSDIFNDIQIGIYNIMKNFPDNFLACLEFRTSWGPGGRKDSN